MERKAYAEQARAWFEEAVRPIDAPAGPQERQAATNARGYFAAVAADKTLRAPLLDAYQKLPDDIDARRTGGAAARMLRRP
jgi:hypothetical protein